MKKICSILLIAAIGAGFASCKKSSSAPSNSARVMFVNGCVSAPTMDGAINTISVTNATSIAYEKSSGYQYVTAGSDSATFRLSAGQALIGKSVGIDLIANSSYSVFVGGVVTGLSVFYSSDDLTAPASGSAKIRIVNLCSDPLSISGNLGATAFATGISYGTVSAFSSIPSGTYDLKAGDGTNIGSVIDGGTQTISSGKIYTAIYTGSVSGTGTAALSVTLISNN